jgi:monomeric sarcosine oxidase
MERFEVIVLGAGGVGSATLYQLARRGVRAVGIDRFNPPHERGSSHGQTRVIRQAYFEHSDYVPLLIDSYREWNELEQSTGKSLFNQIGLIQMGPADGVIVTGVLAAAAERGLDVESMTAAEVHQRWPGLAFSDELVGVFEPNAGYLLVEACIQAHLDAACDMGAKLRCETEVESWEADSRGVRVRTSNGIIEADRLVIAAGAWASDMLADVNVPFEIRRKSLFWFANDRREYVVGNCPVFLFELPQGVFYGFPQIDQRGVKFAEHSGGQIVDDPLEVARSVDANEQRRLVDALHRHLPGVSSRVTDHTVCMYTMSPDEHFVVDRHPTHENVAFAAGLSGHGFKFTPVLGKALAELAIDGGTTLPIQFLTLERFRRR